MATGPILHTSTNSIGFGESVNSSEITRRKFLWRGFLGACALGLGIKVVEHFDNQSELKVGEKLVIPNINTLKLASGEPVTRENNPATLLASLNIRQDRQGGYIFTPEDLSKSGIVVKFPDVRATIVHSENKYLLIRINGIAFVATEGNYNVAKQ